MVAGIAGALVLFSPLGVGLSYLQVSTSGPGARLTYRVLQALTVVVLVLYALAPIAVTGSLVRDGDGHPVVLDTEVGSEYVLVAVIEAAGQRVGLAVECLHVHVTNVG